MMNHLIGDRAFQRGLQSYVNTLYVMVQINNVHHCFIFFMLDYI